MELDFLVASSNQVVDDVRRRSVPARAAEPLVAGQALDDAASIVDAAVSSSSSCRRRLAPVGKPPPKRPSRMLSSSPALIVEAESEIKWLPTWVKAPSMASSKAFLEQRRLQGGGREL